MAASLLSRKILNVSREAFTRLNWTDLLQVAENVIQHFGITLMRDSNFNRQNNKIASRTMRSANWTRKHYAMSMLNAYFKGLDNPYHLSYVRSECLQLKEFKNFLEPKALFWSDYSIHWYYNIFNYVFEHDVEKARYVLLHPLSRSICTWSKLCTFSRSELPPYLWSALPENTICGADMPSFVQKLKMFELQTVEVPKY